MARPRKHRAKPVVAATATSLDHRDAYLDSIRKRVELYKAHEVASILGVDVDAVRDLGVPVFRLSARGNRWDGYTLAAWLESRKSGPAEMATYLTALSNGSPMSATRVGHILGLHLDAIAFLGLEDHDTARGPRFLGEDLARWLDERRVAGAEQ